MDVMLIMGRDAEPSVQQEVGGGLRPMSHVSILTKPDTVNLTKYQELPLARLGVGNHRAARNVLLQPSMDTS